MVALAMAVSFAIAVAISDSDSVTVTIAVTIAVAIAHCRHCCRGPLLRLLWTIAAAISVALPSAIAVAIALAIGHCRLRHCWPSQLPSPSAITIAMLLAISKSWCLGAARIVFDQSKQRILPYFILLGQWAVYWSKPDHLPGVERQWPTPALGGKQQAVSS
jgi:hypothetical protein